LISDEMHRKGKQYFNNDTILMGMIFYAWTVQIGSDRFDQTQYDASIAGVKNKQQCKSITYYQWSRIRNNLIRKLKDSIRDIIFTIRDDANNPDCGLRDNTKSSKGSRSGGSGRSPTASQTEPTAASQTNLGTMTIGNSHGVVILPPSTTGSSTASINSRMGDVDSEDEASDAGVVVGKRRRSSMLSITVGQTNNPSAKKFKAVWNRRKYDLLCPPQRSFTLFFSFRFENTSRPYDQADQRHGSHLQKRINVILSSLFGGIDIKSTAAGIQSCGQKTPSFDLHHWY
jgi:hypothetical protein